MRAAYCTLVMIGWVISATEVEPAKVAELVELSTGADIAGEEISGLDAGRLDAGGL